MPQDVFLHRKKMVLTKEDKSSKESWDKPIVPICERINSRTDMYSASTCSGRISIIKKDPSQKKQENVWVFVTHELTDSETVWSYIENYSGTEQLYFKQESVIMHIVVRTIELAKQLLQLAKESGFSKVGIISIQDTGVTIEVVCPYSISFPVFDSKVLITKEYIEYTTKLANSYLQNSWNVIENFKLKIEQLPVK